MIKTIGLVGILCAAAIFGMTWARQSFQATEKAPTAILQAAADRARGQSPARPAPTTAPRLGSVMVVSADQLRYCIEYGGQHVDGPADADCQRLSALERRPIKSLALEELRAVSASSGCAIFGVLETSSTMWPPRLQNVAAAKANPRPASPLEIAELLRSTYSISPSAGRRRLSAPRPGLRYASRRTRCSSGTGPPRRASRIPSWPRRTCRSAVTELERGRRRLEDGRRRLLGRLEVLPGPGHSENRRSTEDPD